MSEAVRSSLRSAVKGTALVFTGMAVSQALWFVTRLIIVRNLSKEDLGMYSLIVALTGILSLLAGLGLWEGSTRFISVLSGKGMDDDALAVQRASLWIGAITGISVCVLVMFSSGILSSYVFYKPELSLPLKVVSLFIPANVIATIIAAILRGYRIIIPKVYFMDIGQPLFFLLFLVAIFFLDLPFISVIGAYVLSVFVVCALLVLYGGRRQRLHLFCGRQEGSYAIELLKFSIPVLVMDVMFLMFRTVDTLMLGRYGSAGDVGVYSVGVSLAAFLILPLLALEFVYMPIAGELYAQSRTAELAKTYRVLTKWIFSATLPLFFILFFFPEMTISFLFGERFIDAVLPLQILSLGYLFFVFMGTNSMILLVMGNAKAVLRISSLGALLNVLLNYILIKHVGLGMYGAAISCALSFLAITLGNSFLLHRFSGIQPLTAAYLKPVMGSSLIALLIYAVAKNLPLYFGMLPFYFILYIIGYLGSLILTKSIDQDDAMLLATLLGKVGVDEKTIGKITGMLWKGRSNNNSPV